jgi:hypothetical protein
MWKGRLGKDMRRDQERMRRWFGGGSDSVPQEFQEAARLLENDHRVAAWKSSVSWGKQEEWWGLRVTLRDPFFANQYRHLDLLMSESPKGPVYMVDYSRKPTNSDNILDRQTLDLQELKSMLTDILEVAFSKEELTYRAPGYRVPLPPNGFDVPRLSPFFPRSNPEGYAKMQREIRNFLGRNKFPLLFIAAAIFGLHEPTSMLAVILPGIPNLRSGHVPAPQHLRMPRANDVQNFLRAA